MLAASFVAALAACATEPQRERLGHERVVLLSGSDGLAGALSVRHGADTAVLDRPYASARAAGGDALRLEDADPVAIRAQFADALRALPPAPMSLLVYFVFGEDELTDESRRAIAPMLKAIASRLAPEITIIGHADQVGGERVNDALSLRRAERVKEILVQLGVPAARITAAGRGSREPLVRIDAGVPEARNRRAEISVR